MSHLRASEIIINDIDILRKAVAGFPGLEWKEGQKEFKWYVAGASAEQISNGFGKCEHAIGYKHQRGEQRGYEIGVVRRNDGEGWQLVFDPYDGTLASKVGYACQKLVAAYSEAYAEDFAAKNGYSVERSINPETGDVELIMTQAY